MSSDPLLYQQFVADTKFDFQNEMAAFYTDPLRYIRMKKFLYAALRLSLGDDIKDISPKDLEKTFQLIQRKCGNRVQQRVGEVQTEIEDQLEKITEMEASHQENIRQLTAERDNAINELENMKQAPHDEHMAALHIENDQLKNKNEALQTILERLQAESSRATNNEPTNKKDVPTVSTMTDPVASPPDSINPPLVLPVHECKCAELQAANDTLSGMYTQLTSVYTQMEADLNTLITKKDELERLLEEVKRGAPSNTMTMADVRKKHKELNTRVRELSNRFKLYDPCRLDDIEQVMNEINKKTNNLLSTDQ
jgi:DNA repair exonuclease SbcCD ATPase subunit